MLNVLSCNENFLNMKSRICCFSCYNATFYIPRKIFKVTRIRIWTKIKSDRRIGPKNTTDRRICIPLFTPSENTVITEAVAHLKGLPHAIC